MLIIYLFKLLFILILGPLYFSVALVIFIFDKEASLKVFRNYLMLIFKIFQIKLEFEGPGIQNYRNCILVVLNQSNFLDSLICPLISVKPCKGIINIEMAFYPVIGWFYTLISFTIIRQWSNQAKRTLNKANKFLQAGGNVLISIEGKRSHDGKINKYKKGPVVMAIKNQSDIVPIVICGARECLPFGSLWIKPGTIRLRFLEPISTQGLTYENRYSLLEQIVSAARAQGLKFKGD